MMESVHVIIINTDFSLQLAPRQGCKATVFDFACDWTCIRFIFEEAITPFSTHAPLYNLEHDDYDVNRFAITQ